MTEQKIIMITDFIEQKLRKEKELEYYIKELNELQTKINYLTHEVKLTNTIINMITSEQIYDITNSALTQDNLLVTTKESNNDGQSI
mgnify:CR=1 FL=1|tara:strand:- start:2707 stop:2967 length:261 start_codon:yes stop_codon:yes gene_type:complete